MRHQLQNAAWAVVLVLPLGLWPGSVRASEQQVIELVAGWNTVFLEVDPDPPDCATLFAGTPVESVWTYENRFSQNQGENDAVSHLGWRVYIVAEGDQPVVSTLFSLHAGRGYLIRATGPHTWTVTGDPSTEPQNWAPSDYTLQGLFVDSDSPPTFSSYLEPSPPHSGPEARVFSVPHDETQGLVEVDKISTTATSGIAQWMFTSSFSNYSGPVELVGLAASGLEYPVGITEQVLSLRNLRGDARTISVELGAGAFVPMQYFDTSDPEHPEGVWTLLGTGTAALTLDYAQNETSPKPVRLRVRRFGIGAGEYEQTLVVRDGTGYRRRIPVFIAVEGPQGLWVGRAMLNSAGRGTGNLGDAPEAVIPLIVHVSGLGTNTLLRQVSVMWKEGVTGPDPDDPDPEHDVVLVPGRSVLVTSSGDPTQYSSGAVRDGRPFSFRTTSTVLHEDVPLSGSFGSGTANATISMNATHPLNPFMHRYHPDHGHPDVVAGGLGGYDLSRLVELQFTAEDPRGEGYGEPPGWGDAVVGGHYRETIRGLISPNDDEPDSQARHVQVGGYFYLWRVSRVDVLNDGESR